MKDCGKTKYHRLHAKNILKQFNTEITKDLVTAAANAQKNWKLDKDNNRLEKTVINLENQDISMFKDIVDIELKFELRKLKKL